MEQGQQEPQLHRRMARNPEPLSGYIRDNFNFRVGLGRISELGYGMLFGSDVKKQFFQKRIKGRGYCDVGTSVISEFYTPLVPKGHDFLQTIGRLAQERQVMPEQQGKEN